MKPKNKKKQTPIPGLARYLVWMNTKRSKLEMATLRAELADKVYAASARR